jgi:predicted ATPase/DNA-binding winged helix-turn-helix (wHTH) protein
LEVAAQEHVARFYDFGPFRVDTARRALLCDRQPLALTARVFDLLVLLLRRRDRVVSRAELLEALWPDVAVEDGNLSVNISTLRKVLQHAGTCPYIETLPRVGYRFLAEVAEHAREADPASLGSASDSASPPLARSGSLAPTATCASARALFVGRQREMECMAGVARRVVQGERRAIVVTGEAGMGKTALVNAFLERFEASTELWIARGQCVEQYGGTEPYLPILEPLGRALRGRDGPKLAQVLKHVAPTWLAQLPNLRDSAASPAHQSWMHGATPERMVREMADLVEVLARERPVVMCLEDLQWADYSTLDLVAYLAQLPAAACLMLGTYRPAEDGSVADTLAKVHDTLRMRGSCTDVPLEHLSSSAVGEYLTERFADCGVLPSLISAVHERTQGNPLFVVQLADALSEQGPATIDAAHHLGIGEQLRQTLPESTVQRIESEVARLPDFARNVLEAASVAGVEFALLAVAEAAGQDVVQVEALCLNWSRKRRLLIASGEQEWPDGTRTATFRFIHALYQQVLYRRLGVAQRSRLHQRLGECLERGHGSCATEIAGQLHPHFERGLDPRRAVVYLYQAGKTALARGACREAIELLQRGLRVLRPAAGDPEHARRELELQYALGAALRSSRGYGSAEVEQVYTRARVLSDQLDDARARLDVLENHSKV